MAIMTCNGVSINHRCVGQGKDVVLIHGLGANHAFWHLNVTLPLTREYQVTVYDLKGHGYSGMPSTGYTSADMAEDLHLLLNHLDIQEANLIGHSFGGVVALHYAAQHPKRVNSLSIVDSRVRSLQPSNCPRDWPNWQKAKKKLEALDLSIPEDEEESGLWLLEKLALPKWQQVREKLEQSPLFIPFSRWGGGHRSAERWLKLMDTTTAKKDFISPDGLTIDKLSNIQQPTLAISGENSPSVPSIRGLKKYLPNCKTAIVPGTGHFFPLTHPNLFMTLVSRFLNDIDVLDCRSHIRIPLQFSAELQVADGTYSPAVTVDVSKQGILLTNSRELEIGSIVEVIIALNQNGRRVSVNGKVVRLAMKDTGSDYRFGIELLSQGEGYLAWKNLFTA